MSFRTAAEPKNWQPLIVCLVITLFELSMISARASQTKMPGPEPWIVAAQILRNGEYDARGIYLSPGLIITAAHLTAITTASDIISVRIANAAVPATLLKKGEFEDVDLALFSLDQQKLPERIGRIQMPLCQAPPWPGDPVIIVDGEHATQSHIISPQVLPFAQRIKISHLDCRCCQHRKFWIRCIRPQSQMLARNHERKAHGERWQGHRQIYCSGARNSRLHSHRT